MFLALWPEAISQPIAVLACSIALLVVNICVVVRRNRGMLNLAFSSMMCCCDCSQFNNFNSSGIFKYAQCISVSSSVLYVSATESTKCSYNKMYLFRRSIHFPWHNMFVFKTVRLQIAGRNINVALIQNLVLGCNTHCPRHVNPCSYHNMLLLSHVFTSRLPANLTL